MTAPPERDPVAEAAAGVKPDYSRVGFRDLQRLAKARGLPGDGTAAELITRLKAHDVQHGLDVDTVVPADDPEEVDLLADDDEPARSAPLPPQPDKPNGPPPSPPGSDKPSNPTPAADPAPPTPAGGGERVASAPPPAGPPAALPPSTTRGGRPDPSTTEGLVKVGADHGGRDVRAYRHEYAIAHDVTDEMHFRFIAETHDHARAAGHDPKGGPTVGERIGYSADSDGRRTVIYQVPLRRTR